MAQIPALAFSFAMLARFGPGFVADEAPSAFLMPAVALAVDQREPKASPPPPPPPARAEEVEGEGLVVAVVVEVRGLVDGKEGLEVVVVGCGCWDWSWGCGEGTWMEVK